MVLVELKRNSQGIPGLNKFLGRADEVHSGILLAVHESEMYAIVISVSESVDEKDGVRWGELFLVEEGINDPFPRIVARVGAVPSTGAWLVPLMNWMDDRWMDDH